MSLHAWDIVVLLAYFAGTLAAGVWFTRSSAAGVRAYFLGENREKWWMLACSGSATNYSVEGTVANISMLMGLGMMSWYTTLVWWMPATVVLMAYTAIWIRRTGALTSADMNRVRFGEDAGARAACVGFAVIIVVFSVMSLCMSYVVLHKFAEVFGFSGHPAALLIVGCTGVYVMFGGFRGVILTDFIQNVLLVGVSVAVGGMAMSHYDARTLEQAMTHQALTRVEKLQALEGLRAELGRRRTAEPARYPAEQFAKDLAVVEKESGELKAALARPDAAPEVAEKASFSTWNDLAYKAEPVLGRFRDSGVKGWGDFAGAALAWSMVGIIGCFGGAGGRYGEQRYLAAKNARQASWQAALWQCLAVPRWVVTAALAYLAYTVFRVDTVEVVKVVGEAVVYCDPDAVYPLFVKSGLLGPGLRGLIIATLAAAYMSTFSSEANASAAILVNDILKPVFGIGRGGAGGAGRGAMLPSYLATAGIVLAAMACGYYFVEHSSLLGLWGWMLGGLICCIVVPLALRWYWGRMNGWGFTAGCVIGFLPSLAMLGKQFLPKTAWVHRVPDDAYTYAILTLSLAASIVVSLLTPPVDAKTIDTFYRRVRPFGFWGGIRERALAAAEPANAPLNLRLVPVVIVLGVVGTYGLYMAPVYLVGHWYARALTALGVFLACAAGLYFTWYKRLPED